MDNLPTGVLVLLIILVVVAVLIMFWGLLIALLQRQLRKISQQWAADQVKPLFKPEIANYRGHLNEGLSVRGNGVLGLTERDVRFAQFVPRRDFIIPLDKITHLSLHRKWQGSIRPGSYVIAIHYKIDPPPEPPAPSPDGETPEVKTEDAIGLSVRDTKRWLAAISKAAGVKILDQRREGEPDQ